MITKYDDLIKQAAEEYLPGVDWRLVKAQLWQESKLDPLAESPAGAQGIAQFMPKTWNDMKEQMNMPGIASPFNSFYAIQACCFYMREIYDKWTAQRPEAHRYALTLASYNAGFVNLIEAQKLAKGANEYNAIVRQLHNVTGPDNAQQTRSYVIKIFNHFTVQIVLGRIA